MADCRRYGCSREAGTQERDDYRRVFCSVECETKHEHIMADAREARAGHERQYR